MGVEILRVDGNDVLIAKSGANLVESLRHTFSTYVP